MHKLESISNAKAKTTIGEYESNIKAIICPYFEEMQIKLTDLTTLDLQNFYDYQYKLRKDPHTVLHYYRNINQVLKKARKTKLILVNPNNIGLKWDRVNFEDNQITIAHTVVSTTINHKHIIEKKDIPKNSSSYRTFPIEPVLKEFLERAYKSQQDN